MNEAGIAVISLSGELEIGRREEIRDSLRVSGSEPGILIDCSQASYADSTTLAELLRFRAEAQAARIPIALIVGSRQFARVIQYAGLSEVLPIFDTRAAALTYLARAEVK